MTTTDYGDLAKLTGQAIAAYRKRRGLTQEEVAESLKIGIEAVSRIERGVATPSLNRLFQFADIFECNASELLTEISPRPADQAKRISALIKGLSLEDQQLLLTTMEAIANRLRR